MNKTVGQRLREAREALGISLDDAARETHIRLNYLQELESDHPEQLHSAAQARGFLRLYADFLNISFDELTALFTQPGSETAEVKIEQKPSVMDKLPFRPKWLKKGSAGKQDQAKESGVRDGQEVDESTAPAVPDADQSSPVEAPQPVPEVLEEEPELEGQTDESAQEPDAETSTDESIVPEPESQEPEVPAEISPVASTEAEEEIPAEIPSIPEDLETRQSARERLSQSFSRLTSQLARVPFLKKVFKLREESALSTEIDTKAEKKARQHSKTSEDIFKEIGSIMQSRRRMMELSLSDIENFTNLKRAFLVSIEEGRFNELPSTVQGRGMLNNYAKFLGMEETQVLDLYGQALQLQREERLKPQRRPAAAPVTVKVNLPERWRKILNPDLIIGGVLIIGLFVFIIWGATQVFSAAASEPTEAPSISEVLQTTATMPPTEIVEEKETVEATPIPGVVLIEPTATIVATVNAAPLQLYILTHDRAYLSVSVDGTEAFTGRVLPNNVYTYSGDEIIHLLTGNAAALEVYFNQDYLGSLGSVGEVVDVDFTLEGLETPSPQQTSTAPPEIDMGSGVDAGEGVMEEAIIETITPENTPESLPEDETAGMTAE